jgi:hypothetical protein
LKTTIYARVVAKAISFPDDIEMHYMCLDEKDSLTGTVYGPVHFAWEDVKQRFWIDMNYAQLCEGYFREGDSAFLGNKHVTIEVPE